MCLQLGIATPSQVGLSLDPKKRGEMTAIEMKNTTGIPPEKKLPGQPEQGRPRNSTDKEKRKTKTFTPQTGAALQLWAVSAQDKINDIMNPYLLEFYSKKNMRSLSNTEYDEAEITKTKILFSLEPQSVVTDDVVLSKLNTLNSIDISQKLKSYNKLLKTLNSTINRSLTAEEIKHTKSYFYQMVYA
jgi:hypothetical protein